jgi:hypothetical protein
MTLTVQDHASGQIMKGVVSQTYHKSISISFMEVDVLVDREVFMETSSILLCSLVGVV